MTQAHWMRLPAALRERPQWLLAAPNAKGERKIPTTIDDMGELQPGSSTDPSTWLDFDLASRAAEARGLGLGYVLADDDPFTCVDFDIKNHNNEPDPSKWTAQPHIDAMVGMVEDLGSYAELSQSGQGVHVWVLAKFPGEGVKHKGVEVYCRERFMVCTGQHIHAPARPLTAQQDEIDMLVANIRGAQAAAGDPQRASGLYEGEDEVDDDELMRRAWDADNASKFRTLWEGRWTEMGYPSQSEADLALMSMFTFYSNSNEQCRRLFRKSGLGMRDKAVKNDRYLDYTLRLIRGRQAAADKLQAAAEDGARAFAERQVAAMQYAAQLQAQAGAGHAPGTNGHAYPLPTDAPAVGPAVAPAADAGLDWPPGLAGSVAQFIYSNAPRPVKEVAIVGALGLLAGMCGKAWVIPGSGLNSYIILVARSAIGKEAMHGGIGALMHKLRELVPGADAFVSFNDFASGPALAKACAVQTSFVNVAGEFGKKLRRMSNDQDSTMHGLRTLMTNLYQKSGPTSLVGGINYSNKDNNVATVSGVAFSMIGETTPSTLYESLTETMMEDGFLSRFTVVEYTGKRPPANPRPELHPSEALVKALGDIALQAKTLLANHQHMPILRMPDAAALMDAFDVECDGQINSTDDESKRQMWNRAHLKMMRFAALLAVADNHHAPVVQAHHVTWALDLIRRDIAVMRGRIEGGDVGTTDHSRQRKLTAVINDFITKPLPDSYGVPQIMQRDGVVPRKYLQVRTAQVTAFNQHKNGSTFALDSTIKSMVDSGYLVEMDKAKAGEQYTFQGRCYRVVNLPLH